MAFFHLLCYPTADVPFPCDDSIIHLTIHRSSDVSKPSARGFLLVQRLFSPPLPFACKKDNKIISVSRVQVQRFVFLFWIKELNRAHIFIHDENCLYNIQFFGSGKEKKKNMPWAKLKSHVTWCNMNIYCFPPHQKNNNLKANLSKLQLFLKILRTRKNRTQTAKHEASIRFALIERPLHFRFRSFCTSKKLKNQKEVVRLISFYRRAIFICSRTSRTLS